MNRLSANIAEFLSDNGFEYSLQSRCDFDIIYTRTCVTRETRAILPLEIHARTLDEARQMSTQAEMVIKTIKAESAHPIIIPEDRWNRQGKMIKGRLLAHLEVFSQAYARNCEVRRIDKDTARKFLEENHSYGDAACKFRYGLFLKRYTGHTAEKKISSDYPQDGGAGCVNAVHNIPDIGSLIAVATFSNARKWIKDGKEIRSYEWTRYASLPSLRVSGGMGKLLKAFIDEVHPDDIMSYADLEWSEGNVYKALGFVEETPKGPVCFEIDTDTWERHALRGFSSESGTMPERKIGMMGYCQDGNLFYMNFGSRKLRLKLTEYR